MLHSKSKPWAVIWDVDGTLVDTAEFHFAAWTAVARELGTPFSRADFAATFGRRNPDIIHEVFGKDFSNQQVSDLAGRKEEFYRTAARRQGVKLLPGARALLEGLHACRVKQAVGSSAPRANLDLILRLTDIGSFFQALVSSEDTRRGKPDPEVFQLAAARLGVEPARCVVMEDAVAGVQAAKAGGMKCIAVNLVGNHPEAALKAAGADLVVKTLEEVSAEMVQSLFE